MAKRKNFKAIASRLESTIRILRTEVKSYQDKLKDTSDELEGSYKGADSLRNQLNKVNDRAHTLSIELGEKSTAFRKSLDIAENLSIAHRGVVRETVSSNGLAVENAVSATKWHNREIAEVYPDASSPLETKSEADEKYKKGSDPLC